MELRHEIAEIHVGVHWLHAQLMALGAGAGARGGASPGMPATVDRPDARPASESLSQTGLGSIVPRAGSEASTEATEPRGALQAVATRWGIQANEEDSTDEEEHYGVLPR